jgi:hypothetical protein
MQLSIISGLVRWGLVTIRKSLLPRVVLTLITRCLCISLVFPGIQGKWKVTAGENGSGKEDRHKMEEEHV